MAENENVVVETTAADVETKEVETPEVVVAEQNSEPTEPEQNGKASFGAKAKEFFRKRAVGLKRKPQKIAFFFLFVVTIYNLLTLASFSEAIIMYAERVEWVGLMVFVNTLFSILILVAFLNTFPKLKKPNSKIVFTMEEGGVKLNINILMLVLMLVMAVAMIACEIAYYVLMKPFYIEQYVDMNLAGEHAGKLINSTLTLSIAHVVLLGVFIIILLTLPLYRKLIMKINTSVKLESAASNMQEIDLQD